MSSKRGTTDKAQPLEAWETMTAKKGVRTRSRNAKIDSASSQTEYPQDEGMGILNLNENEAESTEPILSAAGTVAGGVLTSSSKSTVDETGHDPTGESPVEMKQQSQLTEHKPTEGSENAPIVRLDGGKSVFTDRKHQEDKDGGVLQDSNLSENKLAAPTQNIQSDDAVLKGGVSESPSNPPTKPSSSNHFALSLHDNSANSDMASKANSSSDAATLAAADTIEQLKAKAQDLQTESQYYRLMSDITMKMNALRRGYLRSALVPPNLKPSLRGLHHILMTEGLKLPKHILDRARVVVDTIELHLTWEFENLKHNVNPSAAINCFVDIASAFAPQILVLVNGEFIESEVTFCVRGEIRRLVLKLLFWIIEQAVVLAEKVTPQFRSYAATGWYDEGIQALHVLDGCFEAVYLQRGRCAFALEKAEPDMEEAADLFARGVLTAEEDLRWHNTMNIRFQRTLEKLPDRDDNRASPGGVPYFDRAKTALWNHHQQAKQRYILAKQFPANDPVAAFAGKHHDSDEDSPPRTRPRPGSGSARPPAV